MSIPDFQTIMRPLLELAADGKVHSLSDARTAMSDRFNLTPEDRETLLPSGRQTVLANRVAWAKIYLERAYLLHTPTRGHFAITDRGRNELRVAPARMTISYLKRFPEFADFRSNMSGNRILGPDEDHLPTDLVVNYTSKVSENNVSNGQNDSNFKQNGIFQAEINEGAGDSGIELERPEEVSIAIPFDPDEIEVATKTMTIDLILSRIASGAIDLQPDFQRRWGIWSRKRQSRLIESLLLRIPLPTFYAAEDEKEDWEIVDGIQRLSTIARFVQPELLGEEAFALEGLEYLREFEGKRHDGLSTRLQRRLRETELVVHLIRHGTPLGVKFNIFARINTGGMALTAQELRHAIIPGIARTVLGDWSQLDTFKIATGNSIRGDRMEDRELVLRFIAFWMTPYQEYRDKDFDGFLAEAMKELNILTNDEIGELKKKFEDGMNAAYAIFDKFAFRKRYTLDPKRSLLNKALFESLSVNLARLNDDQIQILIGKKDAIVHGFIGLCNNRDFDSAISQGTSSPRKVGIRFSSIENMLREAL